MYFMIGYNLDKMSDSLKLQFNAYLDKMRERAKKNRIHSRHQMIGLMVADTLRDPKYKSLYIKMAREEDGEKMLYIAKSIAENTRVKNKGAYFMRMWQIARNKTVPPKNTKNTKQLRSPVKTLSKKMELITTKSKNSKILKQRTPDFNFKAHSTKEIKEVVAAMRKIMEEQGGIGLSANQVGLDWRMFIASNNNKFYVVFNPRITKYSKESSILEEGCLSVPNTTLQISRPEVITLEAEDKKGKKIKFRAFGILARIFQHETDHLDGKLITDYFA